MLNGNGMKFYNYLNEKYDPNGYRLIIENNCSQFLKESKGLPLYRGTTNNYDFKILETYKTRHPSNTIEELQDFADNQFQKKFGWKVRSENSLFGTGNFMHASVYGKHHIIYPFDGYKYIWSNNVRDFYKFIMDYLVNELNLESDFSADVYDCYKENEQTINEYIKQTVNLYKNSNLEQAIKSGHEIMFQTKKYVIISREIYNRIFK